MGIQTENVRQTKEKNEWKEMSKGKLLTWSESYSELF